MKLIIVEFEFLIWKKIPSIRGFHSIKNLVLLVIKIYSKTQKNTKTQNHIITQMGECMKKKQTQNTNPKINFYFSFIFYFLLLFLSLLFLFDFNK
jgi:hypothetical protein